jgi:hypothetical protein
MAREDLEKFASKNASATASANRSGPSIFHYGGPDVQGTGVAHPNFRRTATAGLAGSGGASVIRAPARPYHPLFSSPDRLQLPVQLAQLNQYWRLFYNVDPVIGGAIDMHGDMPWSGAYLIMDEPGDESQTILHAYEDMLNQTELLSWLPKMTREYLIIGEIFPFCFWDDKEGIFTHITLHNPDYVEVVDSPLIDDDPILTLRPSQDLRRILQSTDPRYVRLRNKIPSDILASIAGGKNIPLDPLNASHIARKAFPYDIRGTSIMGRLFRILMYEDAVFNGQIQQAQRHALPLRVFKLGDPKEGWIPSPQNMEEFIEVLAESEVDPLAAIVYHYGLQVEYHGIEGKQLKITNEWDVIERAKLIALGINKSFLHGETTYASLCKSAKILKKNGSYVPLGDIKVGDEIIDKDGHSRKVLDKWDEGVINPMYKIHLAGNKTIIASDKHRWPVWVWPRTCACGCGKSVQTGRLFLPRHHGKQGRSRITSYTIHASKKCVICRHPRSKSLHDAWLLERRNRHQLAQEFFPEHSIQGVFTSWYQHLKHHVTVERQPAFKDTGARWTIGRHQSLKKLPANYEPYQKLPTKDLRIGDYFMVPREFEAVAPSQPIEFARLLGYYVAEGHTNGKWCILTFSADEYDTWAKDACALAETLGMTGSRRLARGGVRAVGEDQNLPNCTSVYIGVPSGFLFSYHGGQYSHCKQLSEEVMHWPLEYKREFITGLFRGDGSLLERTSHKKNKKWVQRYIGYRTTSEQLAYQVELLLAQLGYACSRTTQKGVVRRDGYERQDLHQINIYGKFARDLAKMVWGVEWPIPHSRQQAWVDEKYVYLPIEKIEPIENNETVIDITVEGTHSFLAENVGTYNSANAGLQVLMMRYRTLREMFVSDWIYKKVFAVMAELNGFYRKPKKSEPDLPDSRDPVLEKQTMFLKDRMREIRAIQDPEKQAYEFLKIQPLIEEVNMAKSRRYIAMSKVAATAKSRVQKGKHLLYPHLQFEKRLDVRQDEAILRFWSELAQKGWISPRSVVQGAGLDYDAEMATLGQDAATIAKNQLLMSSLGGGKGPGGGGLGLPLGLGLGPGPGEIKPAPKTPPGEEVGQGAGAPGSAGGLSQPASVVRDIMRKTADLQNIPEEIACDIRAILSMDDTNTHIFVEGK